MNTLKVIIKIGLTVLLAFLLQSMFPWWTAVIACFLINLIISSHSLSSFVSGFLAIGFLWFAMATVADLKTGSILTAKVAEIFSLPSSQILIIVTATIGGIAGGLGALSGRHLRGWIMPVE